MGRFETNGNPSKGRAAGSRNRLQKRFMDDLLKHWEEEGSTAIPIVFRENPSAYLKIFASVMPKEFLVDTGRIQEIGDEELDRLIDLVERRFGNTARDITGIPHVIEGRKDPTHG